jgi:hypothetical protein
MTLSTPARATLQKVAAHPGYQPGFRWRNYLRKLGLIEEVDGRWRPTTQGHEALAS